MKKSELKEMIRQGMLEDAQSSVTEAKKDKEEEEEEDIEIEDIEDIEDTEEVEDIEVEDTPSPDVSGISGDEKKVQDSLESALIAAKELGDEKLINQIGNSITFFTRSHVVGSGEENLEEEVEGSFDEDVVKYNGVDHIITRRENDRIYIRRKEDSAMLGKMDEFWVKPQDIEEDFISEDKQELNENKYVVLSLIDDLNKYMNGDLDKKDIQSSIEIFSTELRNSLFEDENIEGEVESYQEDLYERKKMLKIAGIIK